MQFPSERVEHAANVLAHAMDPDAANPATGVGRCLNTALHALLAHEKWRGLIIPERAGVEGEGVPSVIAFEKIAAKAMELGQNLHDTWDGVEFAWTSYAERYLRYVESVYTYYVPST